MPKTAYPKLHKAVRFAVKAHKKQDRDGEHPLPYVSHPMDVLNRLRYEARILDEDLLCVGVLHDLLEETDVTELMLAEKFGDRVSKLVRELTREEPTYPPDMTEDKIWKLRSDLMIQEIDKMSDEAKIVKLADRCSNLHSAFVTKSGLKLERYVSQSREILKHIPRMVNAALWDQINQMVGSANQATNGVPKGAKKTTPAKANNRRPS